MPTLVFFAIELLTLKASITATTYNCFSTTVNKALANSLSLHHLLIEYNRSNGHKLPNKSKIFLISVVTFRLTDLLVLQGLFREGVRLTRSQKKSNLFDLRLGELGAYSFEIKLQFVKLFYNCNVYRLGIKKMLQTYLQTAPNNL